MSVRAMKKRAEPVPTEVVTASGARANVEGDEIVVRDRRGAVVVRYDGARGETRITSEGDLLLEAPEGKVRIAGRAIELESPRLDARLTEAVFDVGAWELRADRVVERVGDAYQEVAGLLRTRAGRMRTLVRGALQLFGRRTDIASEEDTSIDGKRVLLG